MQSEDDVRLALDAGADAFGLVARMPSGPGPIPDPLIRDIAAAFPERLSILLSSRTEPSAIRDHLARCGTRGLQLVDAVTAETRAAVKAGFPDLLLIQTVHVGGPAAACAARRAAEHADMLLLDSGAPEPADGARELGGTGRTHDWQVSAEIVRESPVPVWLAGGLDAENVGRAIETVRPYGVDVCSRLRPASALDPALLQAFVSAARRAQDG